MTLLSIDWKSERRGRGFNPEKSEVRRLTPSPFSPSFRIRRIRSSNKVLAWICRTMISDVTVLCHYFLPSTSSRIKLGFAWSSFTKVLRDHTRGMNPSLRLCVNLANMTLCMKPYKCSQQYFLPLEIMFLLCVPSSAVANAGQCSKLLSSNFVHIQYYLLSADWNGINCEIILERKCNFFKHISLKKN